MSIKNYIDKLNRYFWFSQEELTHFIIVVLTLSLVYSWTDWGTGQFSATTGLKNYIIALILIGMTVFVHHAGQRMMALKLGFRAENKIWWYGLIISLLLVIITNGNIKFLAATSTIAHLMPIHRLGAFRYGPNLVTIAKIVLAGPILNIIFSALIKSLEWIGILNPYIAGKLFTLNIVYAGWNLLPIPPLDGSKILYYSRLLYAFLFGTIISYVLLVYLLNIYSYIIALLIGCLTWLTYYITVERKL